MTAFNVAMLLTADADQARREVRGLGGDLQGLGQAAKTGGAATAAGMKQAEAQVLQFRRTAEGATGNLVAQFNDIGVMMASGQSPLLMAAQQGTQISQALGPLGARGAVQALGGAFLGMLNPVNFAIFAVVAGLGLMGNALREVFGETKSFADAFDDLEASTKAWRDAASIGIVDLTRQFGTVTPELVELQRQITQLTMTETLLKAAEAAAVLSDEIDKFNGRSRRSDIADLLGVPRSVGKHNPETGELPRHNPVVQDFDQQLNTIATSTDNDERIAALRSIREIIESTVDVQKAENAEAAAYLRKVAELERTLLSIKAAQEGVGSAQQIAADHAARMRAELEQEINLRQLSLRLGENSVEVAEARVAAERGVYQAQLEAKGITGETLADLMALWDAANGVDSGIKGWLASLLDASGASDETRRSVQEAWDAVTGAAGATDGWAGAMAGVAAQVRGIGAALSALGSAGIANASKQVEIDALKAGKSVAEARRTVIEADIRREGDLRAAQADSMAERAIVAAETQTRLQGVELDRQLDAEREAASERDRISSGGARGGDRSRQTDGADRLIQSLERELDLLRETDPVQKEMIRNREALAGASAKTRAEVETLIGANIQLEQQQRQAQEAMEFAGNAAYDALDALIFQGEKASDVMASLAASIGKALLQSALLGSGPLAGLFGGEGTGLIGKLGEAIGIPIPAKADGGWITGPGGPRDDKVLSWLSNGEFVVNAASAARHRPLLEQINAAPRFASGGSVGGGAFSSPSGSGARERIEIFLTLSDDLDARIGRTAEDVSVRVFKGGIKQYDAKVLPDRVGQIQADPRRVG